LDLGVKIQGVSVVGEKDSVTTSPSQVDEKKLPGIWGVGRRKGKRARVVKRRRERERGEV
jgi:hypothetical protein